MGYAGSGSEDGTSYAAPHIAGIILTFGEAIYNGTVSNDRDSNPDVIAAARPLTPTVTASVQNSSPRLDWSTVPDANNYSIERRFEDGSWTSLGTTSNTYYVDQSVGSQNLQVIASPPFDWENFYTYRVKALPIIGTPSLPRLEYFSQVSCTGPGCAQ